MFIAPVEHLEVDNRAHGREQRDHRGHVKARHEHLSRPDRNISKGSRGNQLSAEVNHQCQNETSHRVLQPEPYVGALFFVCIVVFEEEVFHKAHHARSCKQYHGHRAHGIEEERVAVSNGVQNRSHNDRRHGPNHNPVLAAHKPCNGTRSLARGVLATCGNTSNLQVFLVLLSHNVHGVVDRNNAQDVAILVAYRNGSEVVFRHLLGHFFLVKIRGNPYHVAIGKVFQALVTLGHHQCTQ